MTEPQDESGRVGLVGKTLGRYRISAELGRGGMATVYRAYDPQLARDVAIKVIHGAFTGRGDIERRFRREAQAVAALKHEAIVDVFDFAPGGDGEPAYIVSELVEGPTLRQMLDRAGGRILPEVAAVIGARIAAALGAAHARGIVHRDVKPDNVMIDLGTGKGKAGARVLLTDFGIARMIEDDTMTATGSILGSPSYMSPEQAKSGAVGPGSDVFSLGVTLYHMVVGRTPFPGKDPLTVIAALMAGEFLRPSQVDAHVGPELEAVIMRCLRRAPEERYTDGNAVQAALREVSAASARALGDEGAAVRAFHEDHAAFARGVGRAVADAAVDAGRACVRRGELSKALAHINRALAYAPDHRGAEALLATISSRRRFAKVALVGAAVLAAAGAVAGVRATRGQATTPVAAAVAPQPAPRAAAPEPPQPVALAPRSGELEPPPRAATPETPQPVALAPRKAARAPTKSAGVAGWSGGPERERVRGRDETATPLPAAVPAPARKRERTKRASVPTVAPASPVPAAAPEPAPAAAAAVAPLAPSPPPAAAAALAAPPAPTAGITLRARQGFCSPSLDERPPALRPIYQGVSVGAHKIYCTIPGQGRTLAGTYDLRAGTHPDLVIVPGPDGRPTLTRPE